MPTPTNAFSTVLPTYHEWITLTGGKQNRTDPLLKFIDRKVKSHELIFKRFKRKPVWGLLWERLGCELELLYGTGMYLSAFNGRQKSMTSTTRGLSDNAFGMGRIRQDGRTIVHAPKQNKGDSNWSRFDAIEALHSLTQKDLRGLTNSRDNIALHALIRKAKVCIIDPGKYADDTAVIGSDGTATLGRYLQMDELGQYRVMCDNGILKMRFANNDGSPYEWVPAETSDSKNQCAKDLVQEALKKTGTDLIGERHNVFRRGEDEFVNWYRKEHTGYVAASGYVLTPRQRLYMSSEHKAGNKDNGTQGFYHSAYTKGTGVTCSGSIRIEKGVPALITNMSGHYLPEPRKLDYVLRLFEINSVPTDRLAILATTADHKYFYRPGEKNQFRKDLGTMG